MLRGPKYKKDVNKRQYCKKKKVSNLELLVDVNANVKYLAYLVRYEDLSVIVKKLKLGHNLALLKDGYQGNCCSPDSRHRWNLQEPVKRHALHIIRSFLLLLKTKKFLMMCIIKSVGCRGGFVSQQEFKSTNSLNAITTATTSSLSILISSRCKMGVKARNIRVQEGEIV